MAEANLSGLTPEASDALNRLTAAAQARGMTLNVNSAFRTLQDQQQLYANFQAGRAGQPLPFPDRGPVAMAARPGYSPHEFGVAFDVTPHGGSLAELNALAPSLGLTTIAGDPGHFQLANWKGGQVAPDVPAQQNSLLASRSAPAPISAPAAQTSPLAGSHEQFIRDYATKIGLDPNLALGIANAEGLRAWSAKNPNAASGVDIDKATGQPFSYGDFQLNIHPGAMGSAALARGIDPRDPNQWQAADQFALDQMKAKGVSAWSGDPVAKAYLASGKVPGSTINNTGGPGIGAQTGSPSGGATAGAGGVSSTPGSSSTGQPGGALPGFQAGSPAEKSMQAAAKTLGGGMGGGQDDRPPPMPGSVAPPAMATGGPMMMGPGGQYAGGQRIAQQDLAQRGYMLQPSLSAFQNQGTQSVVSAAPIGSASGIPGLPGTTLNSPSQLQMALMTGAINPYDLYAGSMGGMQGYGS